MGLSKILVLTLKMDEEAMSQEHRRAALEAGKGQERGIICKQ